MADLQTTGYGIDQPAGGTTKAARLPCQGPKEVPREDRLSAMAATLSVPTKVAHPCIAVPDRIITPKQTGVDATGHGSPHMNGCGSICIRAIEPSGAATASNATIADGHSSGMAAGGCPPVRYSDRHVTEGLAKGEGVGDRVCDGEGDRDGDDAGVGVGVGTPVGAGLAQLARTTANKSPQRDRITLSDAPPPLGVPPGGGRPQAPTDRHDRQMVGGYQPTWAYQS